MDLRRFIFVLLPLAAFAAPVEAQSPWPSNTQQTQQSPWPGESTASQSPWPSSNAPAQGGFSRGPAQGGFGTPPRSAFDAPPQQQVPPCMKDFTPLRDDAEKKAKAIRAASERHVSAAEACKLFASLVAAEVKMVKFANANQVSCGIPAQIVEQIKASHKNTDSMRARVCQAAAAPQPRGPTLGDALSTTAPDSSNIRHGRGTYDTLTGTPLGGR
jgi:hypothetical protein